MKTYRLKHLPTGFYFMPSREIRAVVEGVVHITTVKSNLSKSGKVYTRRPSLAFIGNRFYSHINPHTKLREWLGDMVPTHTLHPFVPAEWVIEESD